MSIAKVIKKQTDAILRGQRQGPTGGPAVIVEKEDGTSSISTPGTARLDLAAHKISGDHDDRYPLISDLNEHKISGDHDDRYPLVSRQAFVNEDVIAIIHNFGRRPVIQVIGGAGPAYGVGDYGVGDYGGSLNNLVLTPISIIHNTANQATVTLSSADTGEVVALG